jgi:hypothetical protein
MCVTFLPLNLIPIRQSLPFSPGMGDKFLAEIEKLVANSDFIAVLYRYGKKLHLVDVKKRIVSVIEEEFYELDPFMWCGHHLVRFDSLHYKLHVYSQFGLPFDSLHYKPVYIPNESFYSIYTIWVD